MRAASSGSGRNAAKGLMVAMSEAQLTAHHPPAHAESEIHARRSRWMTPILLASAREPR